MIIIDTISDTKFSLNGKTYGKIYQPLAQGLTDISIVNAFDTRQKLVNSTHYSEIKVNDTIYGSQTNLISALLLVIFNIAGGGSGGGTWGEIEGTLSDQGDLQNAFDGKANLNHNHNASAINAGTLAFARLPVGTTGSTVAVGNHTHTYSSLTGIPSTFAPSAHTHTFASLTSKPTTIAGYGITDYNSLGDARWTPLSRSITAGTGLTGGGNLSANRTISVDGTVVRTSGNQNINDNKSFLGVTVFGGSASSSFPLRVLSNAIDQAMVGFYSTDGSTQRGYIGFPSTTNNHLHILSNVSGTNLRLDEGGGVNGFNYYDGSGYRPVYHTGNLTPSDYTPITRTLTAGDGLTGGGTLAANRSFAVDGTVVRTSGNQNIAGVKTLNNRPIVNVQGDGQQLLQFNTERPWAFYQELTGAATRLSLLEIGGGSKVFRLGSTEGAAEILFGMTTGNITSSGTIQASNNGTILSQGITMGSGTLVNNSASDRTKIGVWNSSAFGLGMGASYTFGSLNSHATTFQMSNTDAMGWWWGDQAHTNAQGAMALTTQGYLTLANHMRLGYGESDTTAVSTTYTLQANGDIQANKFFESSDERLKENIVQLSDSIYEYTLKADPNKTKRYGTIAQTIKKTNPELVSKDDNDGMYSVSYTDFLCLKLAEQENEMKAQKETIGFLLDRLEKLEKLIK